MMKKARNKGKNIMIYGIIGLFVMVSFWGIVNILINTFELDTYPYVDVPYFDSSGLRGAVRRMRVGRIWKVL